jgi:bacteriorhodopsin
MKLYNYLNTQHALSTTSKMSLGVQIFVNLIEVIALFKPIHSDFFLVRQLLQLELAVQLVEGLFYIYLVYFSKLKAGITQMRYVDWMITTPCMLVILISYLIFERRKLQEKQAEKLPPSSCLHKTELTLGNIIACEKRPMFSVIFLNALMLGFGFLGEVRWLTPAAAVIAGFIPFFAYFYLIYANYMSNSPTSIGLFSYFFGVWALYGVAAMFPFNIKNSLYNILDLVAKNFFGLFLSIILFSI